jgi:flagellar hook-length control protein FliK
MNIEAANLSSLTTSSGAVESLSPPLAGGSVAAEGFSGALVVQIGLLSNVKVEGVSPLPIQDVAVLQGANDSPSVTGLPVDKIALQDVAALLGNDLPSSYKTKEDVAHEATLAAVTDTLKYMTMGTTAGEKAKEAAQNMQDVIAMAAPVEQNSKDTTAQLVQLEQNIKDTSASAALVKQNGKDAAASAVLLDQNTAEMAAGAEQSIKTVAVMDAPAQMNNDKSGKKKVEGDAQTAGAEDNQGGVGVLAGLMLPAVIPTEQGKTANNLATSDVIKNEALLSFIKPSTGDAKSNLSLKALNDGLPSETVVGQPSQDKQGFNLKYFDAATGQTEKAGLVERQVLSSESEKTLPRVGTDIAALNRPVVENKADVPAITKPLSHPEWNKDLGERIVWMSSKAIPSAEIRLNPQHLGPISVRVNVADDQATVVFTAQHAATREAIEASIPKLREMMGAQQLNLAEVNVSQGATSDQGRSQAQNFAQTTDGRGQQGAAGAVTDGVDDVEQEIESGRAVVSKGLLSIYA